MQIARRDVLLAGGALAAAAGQAQAQEAQAPATAPTVAPLPGPPKFTDNDWARVRSQFNLAPDRVDMSAMLIAAHPKAVREAIARHRDNLDRTPIEYLEQHNRGLQNAARDRIGRYFNAPRGDIALTDSTTMGAGLIYNGLSLRPGQEILTTDQDYYVTHEAIRLAGLRTGAVIRRVPHYGDSRSVSPSMLVDAVVKQIRPNTRVVAITWVHSSTGLKVPVGQIAAQIRQINASRAPADRVLLSVDGVHGFGNQDTDFQQLGADFFFTGGHKWLFGPRGTGMIIASPAGWEAMRPTIPTFLDSAAYSNWIAGSPAERCTGANLTPGGFKAFEHVWALGDAFQLHDWVGRRQVADRTAQLADQLKEGLAGMKHVTLWTPRSRELSAGIVSFDVAGYSAEGAVNKLRDWRVLGSAAPYARQHVRLTPSIRNTPQEVDFALQAIRAMA